MAELAVREVGWQAGKEMTHFEKPRRAKKKSLAGSNETRPRWRSYNLHHPPLKCRYQDNPSEVGVLRAPSIRPQRPSRALFVKMLFLGGTLELARTELPSADTLTDRCLDPGTSVAYDVRPLSHLYPKP